MGRPLKGLALGLVIGLLAISWLGAFDAIILLGLLAAGVASLLAWLSCDSILRRRTLGLAAIVLVGLALNAAFGWWWADPLAALGIAALAGIEGVEAWTGEHPEHH